MTMNATDMTLIGWFDVMTAGGGEEVDLLAFCDWLDEQGDGENAEALRLLPQLVDAHRKALKARGNYLMPEPCRTDILSISSHGYGYLAHPVDGGMPWRFSPRLRPAVARLAHAAFWGLNRKLSLMAPAWKWFEQAADVRRSTVDRKGDGSLTVTFRVY
jgi:hypothetical protein